MNQDIQELSDYLDLKGKLFVQSSESFPFYLDQVGMVYDKSLDDVLAGNQQFLTVGKENLKIVYGWVAWMLTFKVEKSLVWIKPDWTQNSPLNHVSAILNHKNVYGGTVWRSDNKIAGLFSQSTVTVGSYSPCFGCGMSATQVIIEGYPQGSDEWKDIINQLQPVRPHDKPFITIEY